mgnify:CR=1 FL=1
MLFRSAQEPDSFEEDGRDAFGVASQAVGDVESKPVATDDPGIDLASTSTVQPGWGQGTSQSITPLTYTIGGSTPVVPGAGGVAVLAGLGLAGRRRR